MKNLTQLSDYYNSDKGANGHGYTFLYESILHPYKDQKINFLEMGLKKGGPESGRPSGTSRGESPSIKMWLDYFSVAEVAGFDISDFSHQQSERFEFLMGDSGSDTDLVKLSNLKENYDIILDDASHLSYHQQNALKFLWDKLNNNGLYIIEDLQWQPNPMHFPSIPKTLKTWDLFDNFFNKNKYIDNLLLSRDFLEKLKRQSDYMFLYKSCLSPGQLLVLKKNNEE